MINDKPEGEEVVVKARLKKKMLRLGNEEAKTILEETRKEKPTYWTKLKRRKKVTKEGKNN